jgi:hypothetical protein
MKQFWFVYQLSKLQIITIFYLFLLGAKLLRKRQNSGLILMEFCMNLPTYKIDKHQKTIT